MERRNPRRCCNRRFQCSSASRKFSIALRDHNSAGATLVSVLFSEPKILNRIPHAVLLRSIRRFSALQRAENSQSRSAARCCATRRRFQCSSASRKFSMALSSLVWGFARGVSVLFSEPKILNSLGARGARERGRVSVLFSEPKILN